MRIVSENTDVDIARNAAQERVEWTLRELTANLLRITRGAGRAYEIGRQAAALVDAIQGYCDAAGIWPSSYELSAALRISSDDSRSADDFAADWAWAEEQMIRGALQMTAARLLNQPLQIGSGQNELHKGFYALEALRKAKAEERRQAELAARKAILPKAKRRKPRTAKSPARKKV